MNITQHARLAAAALVCFVCLTANATDRYAELRDSILNVITGAEKPAYRLNLCSLGAKGDGTTDCLPAFKRAMRTAEKKNGAHIVVPRGTYYIKGPIHLVSNVCIELEEGAVLKFSPDPEHYPLTDTGWEGTFLQNHSPMIYGYGLSNISIIGRGTIDGNATTTFATWRAQQKPAQMRSREMNHSETPVGKRVFGKGHWLRPQLIQLYKCRNITLEGVKIINSPFWCVHLLMSENIVCRALRYDAKLANNDGIDPECSRNILIEDINFDNGDDNIAIKSGRDNDGWRAAMPSENIVIRRCMFKGLHAVVIGSEMSAGVRNVFVEDCGYAGYCKRGIYVKTNPDRGGYVKNLNVRNCRFGEVEDLLYVTSRYAGEGLNSTHHSEISGLHIDGLRCDTATAAAIVLQGTQEKPITDVTIKNVEVGKAAIGLSIDHAPDVSLTDCHIGGRAGTPSQVSSKDNIFKR